MFLEERLKKIEDKLVSSGKVVVKDLSREFEVTDDCIRKDLKILEENGLLKRTYGGAVLKRLSAVNDTIDSRIQSDNSNKVEIAQKAYDLINPYETIYLDISTTAMAIAEKISLGNKRITVVTNMLDIVNILKPALHIQTILIGGVFNNHLSGFVGSTAIERIKLFKTDIAFIGSSGINLDEEIVMTFDVEDGITKQEIIKSSKKTYLVVEDKKFYKDGVYSYADINSFDGIIANSFNDDSVKNKLKKKGISLI